MKKILILFFVVISLTSYAQTIKVEIDARCVAYNKLLNKAFVAVRDRGVKYRKSLLQLDPYTGTVEKSILLNGNPEIIKFTPDFQKIYVSYKQASQIDKISLADFQFTGTIETGEYNVLDFEILPTDENTLFVALGDGTYPEKTVMYKEGVIQPKQIDNYFFEASSLCINKENNKLYGHQGISSAFSGYLIDIVEDGLVWNGIAWDDMVIAYRRIKCHNNLVYGNNGSVVDPFSDSIPLREARMPLYYLTDNEGAYVYSTIHNCYLFAHETNHEIYISFFHGQYYNYLGSLKIDGWTESINDIAVVDENHFILVSLNSHSSNYNFSLIFYTVEGKNKSENNSEDGTVSKDWFENNLIQLPLNYDSRRSSNSLNWQLDH